MNKYKSLIRDIIEFTFDRHHYIMVSIFILFLVFLVIVLGVNSGSSPFPK
ncbi:MAG: hypothetical protein K0B52_02635 [FCB group bacterium]|nr:hypothetical protein [FCB group bacterium]